MHRGQVGDVVGDDERLDLFARGQGRGVAGVVVAIAIGLIHLPNLAVADVAGALLGRVEIGGREDKLGAGKRGEIARSLLAIDFDQFLEAMDAEDHSTAERAGGLKTILDGGQAVESAELVEHEPCAQAARARQRHQPVDGEVHPERQQRPVHRQIDIVRGHEQDRAGLLVAGDPVADREGLTFVRQEAQDLRVGVEDGADRFRHAGRFWGGQRIGDGVGEEAVNALQVGRHQVLGQREVAGLSPLHEADAHLDEERARGERPEGFGGAAVRRDQRRRGGGELAVRAAVVEDRPGRAARVHRIEDRVARGIVEGFDIGPCQVEDHRRVLTLPHLGDEAPQLRRLARAGGADEHGMRLLGAVRKGDAGERVGMMDAGFLARAERERQNLPRGQAGEEVGGFLFELDPVVLIDLCKEDGAVDQHGPAFMAFLKDRTPPPVRDVDEPDGRRNGDEDRDEEGADEAAHRDGPGGDDLGHIGHRFHHGAQDLAIGKRDVDALARIEIDPVPERRVDLHANELEAMLIELDRHDDEPGCEEGEEPQDEGEFRAREPHQHFVGKKLAAAGEITGIALDAAARGMMGERDGTPVRADVLTRHDIAPIACRFRR